MYGILFDLSLICVWHHKHDSRLKMSNLHDLHYILIPIIELMIMVHPSSPLSQLCNFSSSISSCRMKFWLYVTLHRLPFFWVLNKLVTISIQYIQAEIPWFSFNSVLGLGPLRLIDFQYKWIFDIAFVFFFSPLFFKCLLMCPHQSAVSVSLCMCCAGTVIIACSTVWCWSAFWGWRLCESHVFFYLWSE